MQKKQKSLSIFNMKIKAKMLKNLKLWGTSMILQVKNSTPAFMWQVTVKQLH